MLAGWRTTWKVPPHRYVVYGAASRANEAYVWAHNGYTRTAIARKEVVLFFPSRLVRHGLAISYIQRSTVHTSVMFLLHQALNFIWETSAHLFPRAC